MATTTSSPTSEGGTPDFTIVLRGYERTQVDMYIERLQATFRARLAPLARRTRAGAHRRGTLEAGMWLVGGCYNLVWRHCSLGEERTPAMAAGITFSEAGRWRSCWPSRCRLRRYPNGEGGSRGGCWRPSVQPDHGSMRSYRNMPQHVAANS